jgi:hypothetical protein
MLMGGEERARAARESGDNWARTIAGVGNAVGAGIQMHQEQKAEKKKQAEMAARDAATAQAIQSWSGDPKELFTSLVRIRGPKEGTQMAETIAKFSKNAEDNNPETHLKATHAALGMFLKESPELQAATWGQFKIGLDPTIAKLKLPVQLGDQLTPEVTAQLQAAHEALGEITGFKPTKVEAPKPVEVNQGATLVDPVTGNVIYKGEAKPDKPTNLQHVDLGDVIGVMDPVTGQIVNRIPKGQAPKSPEKAPTLKPLTQGEVKAVTEIDSGLSDAQKLREDLAKAGSTGAGSALGAAVPNFVTEFTGIGADSKKQQAVINRVKQVIGKALEGGVLRKEDEVKYKQILPTIGDAPEVAKAKIDGLIEMLDEKRSITLENLEATGREVSKLKARTPGVSTPAAIQAGQRRIIKGQMAEWDGKGWKAVK